jgi:hypothetical protein
MISKIKAHIPHQILTKLNFSINNACIAIVNFLKVD